MEFNGGEPVFENNEGVAFGTKWKGPDKRGEIINYIHRIEATGT
jgi:hypothetical protein